MANSVYTEFKRMMSMYGEDSIKELMPLIVTILEALDRSLTECNGLCRFIYIFSSINPSLTLRAAKN